MGKRCFRYALATEHACNFLCAVVANQQRDAAFRAGPDAIGLHRLTFRDHQMVVGTGRHLGQMGHCHHLTILPELLHQASDGLGHRAAHARVHFIENQRPGLSQLAGRDRNGQCDTR